MADPWENFLRWLKSEWTFSGTDPVAGLSPQEWEAFQELERELSKTKRYPDSAAEHPTQDLPPEVVQAYAELGLQAGSSLTEVLKAYRASILKHHPDRHAQDPSAFHQATEKTRRLNAALATLKRYWATRA